MHLIVTGHCHAPILGQHLGALLPEWRVHTHSTLEHEASPAPCKEKIDAWIRIPMPGDEDIISTFTHGPQRTITIPATVFSGYHPDCVYATTDRGTLFRSYDDYHSAIALWAWKQGATPAEASRLFSAETMRALGYLDMWRTETESLWTALRTTGLDINPMWDRLKRGGTFMHTINHPTAQYFSLLAKAIASELGSSVEWDEPTTDFHVDATNGIVWPVYPPVALQLGVPGCYLWKSGHRIIRSLEAFLEETWLAYGDSDPSSVRCQRLDDGRYDTLLQHHLAAAREAVSQ